MTLVEAVVLGVVQGITEFLPISSSGHLALLEHYLHVDAGGLSFDILLHVGTLVALVADLEEEPQGLERGAKGAERIGLVSIAPRRETLEELFVRVVGAAERAVTAGAAAKHVGRWH